MEQQGGWPLRSIGTQVQFPVWHSGFRIRRCCSCPVGHNCSSDLIYGPGTVYATGRLKKKKIFFTNKSGLQIFFPHSGREISRIGCKLRWSDALFPREQSQGFKCLGEFTSRFEDFPTFTSLFHLAYIWGLEGWRHLSTAMKLDPWDFDVRGSLGERTLRPEHARCMLNGVWGLRLQGQNHKLQEPFALWTLGKCLWGPSQHIQGASAGLMRSLLELQNYGPFLLLLREILHIPVWASVFNRRIGTIQIFLCFPAWEGFAQTIHLWAGNHVKCLYFSGETGSGEVTCVYQRPRGGSFRFDVPLLCHILKGQRARVFKNTGFGKKSSSTTDQLCDIWEVISLCSPVPGWL